MYGANTTNALRGDYSRARADFTVEQSWHSYSEADHVLWRRLYARQSELVATYACREFAQGLAQTRCAEGIPDLNQVSDVLEARTGWRLLAVPGLIPNEQFFGQLAARRFPVTVWLRKPEEFDYIVEPDIFHDFFGHAPMLFNPVFADYMQAYGRGGIKAHELGAIEMLARLYWYTVEFGLIDTPKGLRTYGAGILSSGGEISYCLESPNPNRIGFDLLRIMQTRYKIDTFQETYFVIRDFGQLFEATAPDFTSYYEQLRGREPHAASAVLATDRVYHRGAGPARAA